MKVSDFIVEELIKRGVKTLFTLQGGYSQFLNDSIGHSALRPIYMLTEAGASYAAAGWAQYTGKMGVLVVTSGLAQINVLSGVASAYSDYLPMMVISGDIKSELSAKRDMEHLRQGGQQDVPIVEIAQSITKGVCTTYISDQVRYMFKLLWELALTKPSGPVFLNIPIDIQQAEIPE
jgi:acetolactate synthase-1/2/3 large subunit